MLVQIALFNANAPTINKTLLEQPPKKNALESIAIPARKSEA
jgi:hypothetical protein